MDYLPKVNCIYSVKDCQSEQVASLIRQIEADTQPNLKSALRCLESYILALGLTELDVKTSDYLEVSIGEVVLRYGGIEWKELTEDSAGMEGYGILLSDGSLIVPRIMLSDLLQSLQPGTLEYYVIGIGE